MRSALAIIRFAGQDPKAVRSSPIASNSHVIQHVYLAQPAKHWANVNYDEFTLALIWAEEPQ